MGLILIFISTGFLAKAGLTMNDSISPLPGKNIEFTFDRVVPVYTFRQELGHDLYGFSFMYLWERTHPGHYDFWGISLDYSHIDSDVNTYIMPSGIGHIEVEDRTSSSIWGAHFHYRYYPEFFFWRIEPFVQASFGGNMYITSTARSFFDEEGSADFDIDAFDMSLSYGLGLGFSLQIYGELFFIFKSSLYGGNAVTYLVKKSEQEIVPLDNFGRKTSQTNNLRFQIGIAVNFI